MNIISEFWQQPTLILLTHQSFDTFPCLLVIIATCTPPQYQNETTYQSKQLTTLGLGPVEGMLFRIIGSSIVLMWTLNIVIDTISIKWVLYGLPKS